MLVIAHRPEWQASFNAAYHVTPLALNRLGKARTDEMVRAAGGDGLSDAVIDQIVSRTDGIPLFVEELTKSVLEAGGAESAIPETLQASLLARLDRLGPAKHIAQVGSVIGRDFDHQLLLALIGGSESELQSLIDHLIASELVQQQGRPPNLHYVFKHALIQEVAYDSLLKSRRRELHGEIARALFAQSPEQAALLAHHWERAEDLEQAFACRIEAAKQAFAIHALWEAISQYWGALDLLDRLPETQGTHQRHIATVCAIIRARDGIFWQNEEERRLALRHLDQAIRAAGDSEDLASLARLEAFKGVHWSDESFLSQAVEHADTSGDKATQAEVSTRYSTYLGMRGRYEDSYTHTRRAIEMYEQLGETVRQGLAMVGEGRCYSARAGRLEASLLYARRAREIAEATGDLNLKAWLAMESEPYMYKGLWEEMVNHAEEGLPAAWEIGDWLVVLFTSAWAAIACVKLGRLEDARRFLDEALKGLGQRPGFDYPQSYLRMALSQVQLASGETENALTTALSAAELAGRGGYLLEEGAAYRALGQVYAADGNRPEAEAAFRRSLEIFGEIQSRPELAQSLLAYGRFLLKTNAADGKEQLGRAHALFEELDATGWVEETHAALATA